jgi:23S rRNA (pseudouridine1915-N3)-methyltransferase
MQISIIAIGTRMPSWVNDGVAEYVKRLPSDFKIRLIEIPAEKRLKSSNISKILQIESEKLFSAMPVPDYKIALDRKGAGIDTLDMAKKLGEFKDLGRSLSILIGGPEGISEGVLGKMDALWSLSKLTLPHPLVRIVLAEQFYRAWSIISSRTYHR